MEILLILFVFLFGGCLESCAVPNGTDTAAESVIFTLPVWQSDLGFPELDCWEITTTNNQKQKIPATEFSFSLALPKNKIIAVTARPITKNSHGEQTLFFYPAGTVYPNLTTWNGHQAENTLTWEDGYTAKILESIYGAAKSSEYSETTVTNFVEQFNWKKFSETIFAREKKSTAKFYNPWQVNTSELIQKLISKNFNANSLTVKDTYALPVDKITVDSYSDGKINISPEKIFSPYIPEKNFILLTETATVSKTKSNHFLYDTNYVILVTAQSEKKVSTDIAFLPKIIRDEE